MTTQKLQQAITAIRNGQKEQGRMLLSEILREDPKNEYAWIWMARVVDTKEKRKECLVRALRINPENETVRSILAGLDGEKKPAKKPPRKIMPILVYMVIATFLVGACGIGALVNWMIRDTKTEYVPVSVLSTMVWGVAQPDTYINIGHDVRIRMEGDRFQPAAVDTDAYDNLFYWTNAELVAFTGYLDARLPLEAEDLDLMKFLEGQLVFQFKGPANLETYESLTTYVVADVGVSRQNPLQLKLSDYKLVESPPYMTVSDCATFIYETCGLPIGTEWVELK